MAFKYCIRNWETGDYYTGTGFSEKAADAKGYSTRREADRAVTKLEGCFVYGFPAVHKW